MNTILAIFLGGGLGSLARWGVTKLVMGWMPAKIPFPAGTLAANLLSCAVLGATIYYFKDRTDSSEWLRFFLIIGFCGGFSTFSTFSFENMELMKNGAYIFAVLNILISVLFCGLIVYFLAYRQS